MKVKKPRKGHLIETLLRSLVKRSFESPTSGPEEHVHGGISGNNPHSHGKEIETAWLEAERKKAEAVEWQRRRFIC